MTSSSLYIEFATSSHWLPLAHGQFAYRHNINLILTVHARTVKLHHLQTGILARRSIDTIELGYYGQNSEFPELNGRLLWVGHLFFRI